jgi:hypothetical protein
MMIYLLRWIAYLREELLSTCLVYIIIVDMVCFI